VIHLGSCTGVYIMQNTIMSHLSGQLNDLFIYVVHLGYGNDMGYPDGEEGGLMTWKTIWKSKISPNQSS